MYVFWGYSFITSWLRRLFFCIIRNKKKYKIKNETNTSDKNAERQGQKCAKKHRKEEQHNNKTLQVLEEEVQKRKAQQQRREKKERKYKH